VKKHFVQLNRNQSFNSGPSSDEGRAETLRFISNGYGDGGGGDASVIYLFWDGGGPYSQ
jgi:hypothetical protein